MRIKTVAVGLVALIGFACVATAPSLAFGWKRYDRHSETDPYAYNYEHRGYYPYYGSHYWRPAYKVRNQRHKFVQPRYHQSWGLYKKHISKYHHSHPHGTVAPHTHRKHHWYPSLTLTLLRIAARATAPARDPPAPRKTRVAASPPDATRSPPHSRH